jgi:truncated hemoglobin YjbI
VSSLKSELEARGVPYAGLVEKSELVDLLEQHYSAPKRAGGFTTRVPKHTAAETQSGWRTKGRCPFSGSHGYTTEQGRHDWLEAKGIASDAARAVTDDVRASPDLAVPLYYWQLYSLLGPDAITGLVRRFYGRVLGDTTPGSIASAFTRIADLDHHVATQSAFWIDAFGGGRHYHGGDYRLNFHHENNAASVMNAQGAKRWMLHMGRTLCDARCDYSAIDPRIKPCIVDFLRIKVRKYASASRSTKYAQWRFDEGDFSFVARDSEMVALYRSDASANPSRAALAGEDEICLKIALATAEELPGFKVRELRRFLEARGVEHSHCVEKSEMLALAIVAL